VTRRDAAALAVAAALGAAVPDVALRFAGSVLLDLGPNDAAYIRGFRADWERDGRTTFRWSTPSAAVLLPMRATGQGHVLRLRARRHFIEPSNVTVILEDRIVARFAFADDGERPYRVLDLPLPGLRGDRPLALRFEAQSANARPLALALDWLEVTPGSDGFRPLPGLSLASVLVLLSAVAAPRLAGASLRAALLHGCGLALAAGIGLAWHPLAGERILSLGAPVYAVVAIGAVLLARVCFRRFASGRGRLAVEDGDARCGSAVLVALVLAALAARLLLLLHPQFFYPDVKVHALFAWQLAKDGPGRFLEEFTAHQYRYSLGLQFENGHWYAFPYPPGFYFAAWPLLVFAGFAPEVGVSVLAATINTLQVFLIHGLTRRITGSHKAALVAAGVSVVLPIYLVRLGLAYFPALAGHAVDSLVLLVLLSRLDRLDRPRSVASLGTLIAAALLTYTQSLLNLGLVLPLALLLMAGSDSAPGARRRQLGLLLAGVLGLGLALAAFYGRYVPVFVDMQRGVPMPEERILTELQERRAGRHPQEAEPPDDPYAGPNLDLVRGLKKAAWRLWIFYGPFAPLVAAAVLWLVARADSGLRPVLIAWALAYPLLNLASGGLPGPNLVRYNKDMELVAPLCCAALGWVAAWLWERGGIQRALSLLLGVGFAAYGGWRGVRALISTFVLER
jgi:hypothetical protein